MLQAFITGTALLLLIAAVVQAEPLTLTEALSKRASASQSLKMARIDEQVAEESILLNRSGYLPQVDFQGGYTAQQAPQSISLEARNVETQQPDFGFFNVSLYQTLYDFGRTGARYDKSLALREASRFSYQSLKQDLFLLTVSSYFRILQGQKLLKAAVEEVAQMTDHLRIARNLFEQGVVTRNDLLQAEVRLASSKQHRLETANRLENFWLDLNNQIGEPPEFRKDLVEETQIALNELDKPAEQAITSRAELEGQRKLLEGSERAVVESRTGYYPVFFTKLSADYVQNDKVKEQVIMAATVGLKINLFDGFATTARYRQAVQNRARAEEQLLKTQSDILLEYRTAVNDAKVAKERISVTETSIKQGEENLRINKDRYQEQVGTATDVIDAQTLLTQIRTDYYQALFDYEVALARVKRARGEL